MCKDKKLKLAFLQTEEGYYPAWLFCEQGAAIEITNMYHMLRTVNEKLFYKANIAGSHQYMLSQMDEKFQDGIQKQPQTDIAGKLYFCSYQGGESGWT